jgi:Carbon dioxide concentrating mechanism/carboxysome shell protein
MEVARVIGSVVSTVKDSGLTGSKLLVVEPLGDPATSPRRFVAIDAVGAGRGEVVLVVRGSAARSLAAAGSAPVDAAIIAIVDRLESDSWVDYTKD